MTPDPAFVAKFDSLPEGGYGGTAHGLRWRVTKATMAGGRSQKLEAEELGGTGYISFNLYRLATGQAILKPCEMPAETVTAFVADLAID
jgi:hypothetical protein